MLITAIEALYRCFDILSSRSLKPRKKKIVKKLVLSLFEECWRGGAVYPFFFQINILFIFFPLVL